MILVLVGIGGALMMTCARNAEHVRERALLKQTLWQAKVKVIQELDNASSPYDRHDYWMAGDRLALADLVIKAAMDELGKDPECAAVNKLITVKQAEPTLAPKTIFLFAQRRDADSKVEISVTGSCPNLLTPDTLVTECIPVDVDPPQKPASRDEFQPHYQQDFFQRPSSAGSCISAPMTSR